MIAVLPVECHWYVDGDRRGTETYDFSDEHNRTAHCLSPWQLVDRLPAAQAEIELPPAAGAE